MISRNQFFGLGRIVLFGLLPGIWLGMWLGASVESIWKVIYALNDLTNNTTSLLTLVITAFGTWRSLKANNKPSIVTAMTNMPEVDSEILKAAITDPALRKAAEPK